MKTIYDRMRAALPHARALLADSGIDVANDLRSHFSAVGGDPPDLPDAEGEQALMGYADNVFVLGLATGLLLDKQVLKLAHQAPQRSATTRAGVRSSRRR